MLIYFNNEQIGKVVRSISTGLCDGGLLVIGEAESLSGHDSPFKYVEPHIYRKSRAQ